MKVIKHLLVVAMLLAMPFGAAHGEVAAKKQKPPRQEKVLVVAECSPWIGSSIIMAVNFADGRRFTARLWGASAAKVREGQPVIFTDAGPTAYLDVSGETGEARLCDRAGTCNSVKVEIKVKLEDKTQGSIAINDETIPTTAVYDKTKETICG